jgi:hypothetical protein
LLTGALYFNTVDNAMKVYNGSSWLDAYASLSGALIAANNLSDLNNTATARTNLGVAIGTNVQAYDAQLADVAGLTPTDNGVIIGNGTNFVVESGATLKTSLGLTVGTDVQAYDADLAAIAALAPTADNFIVGNGTTWTLETPAQSRTSLGLGTAATTASTDYATAAQGTLAGTALQPAAIGSTVQGYDADLQAIGALAGTTGLLKKTAANTWSLDTSAYVTSAVTSVTGTSPVVSSGGTTPAISMPAATTSASGYLTSTDWNTFNGKQAAGSYVTVGGALGTPSSGTLTNCTFPTLNQNTTGTAANVTGTVAVANGGTGSTTLTANNVLLGNGTSAVQVVAPSTSGNVLTSNGTTWTSAVGAYALTSGTTIATTSGTTAGFTGLPSWVKRITVMFNGVSVSGTSTLILQIGSTTYTTTGYSASTVQIPAGGSGTATTGFPSLNTGAANTYSGIYTIATLGSNIWVGSATIGLDGNTYTVQSTGRITLGGTLDRIRLTTVNGTDTFDAGSINILYE